MRSERLLWGREKHPLASMRHREGTQGVQNTDFSQVFHVFSSILKMLIKLLFLLSVNSFGPHFRADTDWVLVSEGLTWDNAGLARG